MYENQSKPLSDQLTIQSFVDIIVIIITVPRFNANGMLLGDFKHTDINGSQPLFTECFISALFLNLFRIEGYLYFTMVLVHLLYLEEVLFIVGYKPT